MKKKLFELLESKRKYKNSFHETEEFAFFLANKSVLKKIAKFSFLSLATNEFDILRANIIIKSYFNKLKIEEEISNVTNLIVDNKIIDNDEFSTNLLSKISDLPYLLDGNNKIYITFFSRPINNIYLFEPTKILEKPYSYLVTLFDELVIDSFDYYGNNIFSSNFVDLEKVWTNGKETAFFFKKTNNIFLVDSQGRLDLALPLFDKYMNKISLENIEQRIAKVIEAYYDNSKALFIDELFNNNFISSRMYGILKKHK
ncbi:MAG: hypothetical protein ACI31G_04595 [Bacilli bacterium]